MPTVSFNSQSFNVDGRKLWILAASMQYTRIPPELWRERLAAARQAGFNTIETACPWVVHEPRRGRYDFDGNADVRSFVEACGNEGLRVILRPGPYVGGGFDGGGLPAWLTEDPKVRLREANEAFLDRTGRYVRKLFGELADQLPSKNGPILLVQVEHDWTCANDEHGLKYLGEVARLIREAGVNAPLINRNNLWLDAGDTIDCWRGDDQLLVNLRQLRIVQPNAPRIAAAFERPARRMWGQTPEDGLDGATMMRRIAEILASGAQPIVTPFHGGTNFGFLAGRRPGPDGGTATTSAAAAPLGEAGARGETYQQIRRLVTFADQFGPVFADFDPEYHPVSLEPGDLGSSERKRGARSRPLSVVPQRGAGGRVVFVFSDGVPTSTALLLDDGIRLPVHLDDQPVSWFVLDVDLQGRGRLDYANLSPFAIVDRSIVVLHGPARSEALLSVGGSPLQAVVPSGAKPLVLEHKGVTFVICNRKQIDATYFDDERVYVGTAGLDADGAPLATAGWAKGWVIDATGKMKAQAFGSASGTGTRRTSIGLRDWKAAPSAEHIGGTSPRYASLAGPQTLPACGAPTGYGWYRIKLKTKSARKRLVHLPQAAHRVHLYRDGNLETIAGSGPGADAGPFELSLPKGESTLTVLADNMGRYCDGNDLGEPVGLHGHLYEVKALRTVKAKAVTGEPVDPFTLRAFIKGGTQGRPSDVAQASWTFTHAKKAPLIFEIDGAESTGTLVLNDEAIAWYAGASGSRRLSLMLDPSELPAFKRGKNILRFAPEIGQKDAVKELAKSATLYECVENLSGDAKWGFAKWDIPSATGFKAVTGNGASRHRGAPCWWSCSFTTDTLPRPLWFQASGLSKGQLFVNGHNAGRYFTSTRSGRAVGPQTRLYVPEPWVHLGGPNELLIFDEHGFAPTKSKLVFSETGDLD